MRDGAEHGGAFYESLGDSFEHLDRLPQVIAADVLDAWFPPSPKVVSGLEANLSWLLRTSPPTDCAGLVREVASRLGVAEESVLVGSGSSSLIFLALRHWLNSNSSVLLLDPSYGEYEHLCRNVIGCRVEALALSRTSGYELDIAQLAAQVAKGWDLVILVNPNSPTGRYCSRESLLPALGTSRVWIDETYLEYAGGNSLEGDAAVSENLIVCKSMSKAYALSGERVGYLVGSPAVIRPLRAITPPWAVSGIAQFAAIAALRDPDYFAARWEETRRLRSDMGARLTQMGLEVVPGEANFLLCHLRPDQPTASEVVVRCRQNGLYLRDCSRIGQVLGDRAIRIAVKDLPTNQRMLELIAHAIEEGT